MSLEEPRVVRDELLCSGRRVKLFRRILARGEDEIEKDLVSFGSSVVIIPLLDDGRVVFLRQYRAAIASWILELPAGRVEDGEDPREAAIRELEEETGYRAQYVERVASAFVSPGYSDELMHIFIAKGLKPGIPHPERGEILEKVLMRPEEYLSDLDSVKDMKSIASILLLLHRAHE
ncbi:NUDIX hydrolase [Candidatus Korarchaeum cryptofilum]|jgi:ADP-ribose pyrophosphatase|uniref:NUDIX hydrolase n=1 Tax=Candidatus Korarchaeum cryptofilum TaxID=498846 RepID=A0A429G1E3_9CREN|nr:NUDIX hydrolase [Candidatus Korarchaeum cryptofilum]RSN67651.1 NUDIX hydrolase [Candidatus Korarchaeum cryptofilum]